MQPPRKKANWVTTEHEKRWVRTVDVLMKAERHGSQRFVFSYLNSVIVALYVAPTSRDSVQCLVKEINAIRDKRKLGKKK